MNRLPSAAICILICACASAGPALADPRGQFEELESRLLAAEVVETEFHITSTGAVASDVRGSLRVQGDHVELFAQGEFMSQPLRVELMTVGEVLRGGQDLGQILGPTPPALREGVLLGLTRMGLLHNIAMLAGDNPPDGTDGKVREWVQAVDAEFGSDGALHFGIVVGGTPSGVFDLHLEDGLPTLREQSVQFPQGEMLVVERYSGFTAR